MTIFLTGGDGKTSRRIAAELASISPSTPILRSSRSASPSSASSAKFDWLDRSTYTHPFTHPLVTGSPSPSPISAIYIVLPAVDDPLPAIREFVDIALEHQQSYTTSTPLTLVLLSSAVLEADAQGVAPHSRVHAYLKELVAGKGARRTRYAVLRPSFFMENFSEQEGHLTTLRGIEGKATVVSATGPGREAFVSAEDIAAVGARCLLGACELDAEYVITGPEMLSYGDVAAAVAQVTGKEVSHTDLTTQQLVDRHVSTGMPEDYAGMLAALDEGIRNGQTHPPTDTVERVVGRKGITFQKFAEDAKSAWV